MNTTVSPDPAAGKDRARKNTRTRAGAICAFVLVLAASSACGSANGPATSPSATSSAPISSAPNSITPSSTTPGSAVPKTPVPNPTPRRTAPTPPRSTAPAPAQTSVVLSRIAYAWHWPNDPARPGAVSHTVKVPPVPELIGIGAGDHPSVSGERAFSRMSFTFNAGFPGYRFEYTDRLIADASGKPVPLDGTGILRIVFTDAQAHTADGAASTILWQPPRHLGLDRMVDYAQAGDFEGHLSYGIGTTGSAARTTPPFQVRAYEVETVTAGGQHRYTVAIDIDATE